jgi:hypothetical protein
VNDSTRCDIRSQVVKRDNITQQFKKLQGALDNMGEFDVEINSRINRLKPLVERNENFALTTLGALREERMQHECSARMDNHPKLIMKKGRMIECYLCSQNHFMRNCPTKGSWIHWLRRRLDPHQQWRSQNPCQRQFRCQN